MLVFRVFMSIFAYYVSWSLTALLFCNWKITLPSKTSPQMSSLDLSAEWCISSWDKGNYKHVKPYCHYVPNDSTHIFTWENQHWKCQHSLLLNSLPSNSYVLTSTSWYYDFSYSSFFFKWIIVWNFVVFFPVSTWISLRCT